jgi:signal transduction histidine kinase
MSDTPGETDSARLLQAFSDAVKALSGSASLDEVLRQIAHAGRLVTDARYGALAVFAPDGSVAQFVVDGLTAEAIEAIGERPRGLGLLGAVVREGRPIRVRELSADPRSHGFPPHHPSMGSFLGVPIRLGDEVIGNLYVTDKQSAPEFTERDEWVATLLAEHAAIAVDKARLARAREAFISVAAHELRTPVGAAQLAADTAAEAAAELGPEAPLRDLLEQVQRNIADVAHEMEELLDVSRLERGTFRLRRSTVDLRQVCRAACERMAWTYGTERIDARLGAEPVEGRWDRQRLERTVANLLENALRYSSADCPVRLEVETSYHAGRVLVRDRGPGIPPDELDRVWKPFAQGSVATTDHRGAGLGLYVVRETVEAHGGHVAVESEVGVGTTVVIELPKRPHSAETD